MSVYVYLGRGMCARAGVCRCVSVWALCLSVSMWMCNESPLRDVPLVLHLDHEHERREDEAKPADDLWDPVHPVHDGARHGVEDGREGGDACDPEDGGCHELDRGAEEADFFEVVGFEFGEGGKPATGVVTCVLYVRGVDSS